jgi:hypothetical protein
MGGGVEGMGKGKREDKDLGKVKQGQWRRGSVR